MLSLGEHYQKLVYVSGPNILADFEIIPILAYLT
jgi:hypothetical protein